MDRRSNKTYISTHTCDTPIERLFMHLSYSMSNRQCCVVLSGGALAQHAVWGLGSNPQERTGREGIEGEEKHSEKNTQRERHTPERDRE